MTTRIRPTTVPRRATIAAALVGLLAGIGATPAAAQTSGARPGIGFTGFVDTGVTSFAAAKTFDAVLDTHSGSVFGGGVEVTGHHLFVQVRGTWFTKTGQRVFPFNSVIYKLGIPVEIAVRPVDVIAGYRLDGGWRVVPYAGAGYTSVGYRETSSFADASENVDTRYRGYLVMGGVQVRVWRWIGLAGEVSWSRVGHALGHDGVSKEFGESDLGGTTGRVKIVVGR